MNREQGLSIEPLPQTNWVMSRMDIDSIYKICLFEFKKAYSVKTHEEAISLQSGLQTIGMINPIAIESHLKSNYRFMQYRISSSCN